MKVELHLPNYATKTDLKNAAGVNTSKLTKNVDLASLRSEVDKLDIDKSEKVPTGWNSLKSKEDKLDVDKLVPADLSKLSDLVKMMLLKRLNKVNLLKNLKLFRLLILVKKLIMTQILVKLKNKLLVIVISILLHKNLIH